MRRLVGLTVLAIALVVPTVAFGVGELTDDGALSVKNGVGRVALAPFNGSALGRVAHGRIKIVDTAFGDGGTVDVWGCDNGRSDEIDRVTICFGNNLRFRIVDGRYAVFVRGSGINLSAVGRGTVTLDGRGDDPTVEADGVYSLNDAPYRSLPDLEKPLPLAPTES
jgi:hypothetical protein